MAIVDLRSLYIPEIKIVRSEKFFDPRGYFTELFKISDLNKKNNSGTLQNASFVQINESHSQKGVVRGLHFQWDPYVGKLVRTIQGHMVDLVLDIRKKSPTFGKIIAFDMPADPKTRFIQWIWIPVGFAHGNFFLEPTTIEYLCTGEYNPECEAGITPLALDIDWSLCDKDLRTKFMEISNNQPILSTKDRNGYSLAEWKNIPDSDNFIYSK